MEAFPARACITGAKYVALPSREKCSGFDWMGCKNGRMLAGRPGKATVNFLPRLLTRAAIDIRFGIRIAMRTQGRGGSGYDDVICVSRVRRDTPQILMPQTFL